MSSDESDASETVDRLLEETDERLEEADAPEELAGDDDLQSLADEARAFLDDVGTAELLDAVGVDASEGSSPADLLMGLEEADTEPLVRRRRLERLSEIGADGDDRSALEEFEALGAALEEGAEADVDPLEGDGLDVDDLDALGDESNSADDATDAGDGTHSGEATDGADVEAGPDDEQSEEPEGDGEETAESGDGAGDDEPDGGLAEHAGALRDVVDEIKGRDPDAGDRTEDADESQPEGDDGEVDSSGSRSSKIAASDRADMRVPLRHSTMPK